MMTKFYALALSAVLGAGAFALSGNTASAAAISAFGGTGVTSGSDLLQEVSMKRKDERKWNRKRHGDRHRHRHGHYRYYHDGYYYRTPWWSLAVPLIIGGAIAASGDYSDNHVEWCLDHYRSYNPNNNTWLSYSGHYNQCNSPYN